MPHGCVQEAVGAEAIKAAHNSKWRQAVDRSFGQVRERKVAEAKASVEQLLGAANATFSVALSDPSASADSLSSTLQTFLAEVRPCSSCAECSMPLDQGTLRDPVTGGHANTVVS